MSAEATSLIGELKRLLDLDPSVREYEVIGSSEPENRRQIAMQTYSLYQIMAFVASRVDIPAPDVAGGRALPKAPNSPGEGVIGEVAVRSGNAKPQDPFVAANFHGHWFWVDRKSVV